MKTDYEQLMISVTGFQLFVISYFGKFLRVSIN